MVVATAIAPMVGSSNDMGSVEALPYFYTEGGNLMAWQDDLKRYATDKTAAQREIERAKQVYMEEQAKGASKERLDQINRWANQVREASGIGNDDPTYGNDPRTYKGSSGSSKKDPITTAPPVFQPQYPQQGGSGMGNGGNSQQLLQMLMGMMSGGGGGLSSQQQKQYQQLAQQRAAQERQNYNLMLQALMAQQNAQLGNYQLGMSQLGREWETTQRQFMQNMMTMNNQRQREQSALDLMMKQAWLNRELGLQGVQNSTESAKAALEDRSFQNYLESRQNIADRGMSGSGIAADADTRLMLAKQGQMADIMRDAALQEANVQNQYSSLTDRATQGKSDLESQYGVNLMGLLGQLADAQGQLGGRAQQLNMNRYNTLAQFQPQFQSVYDRMGQIDETKYLEEMLGKAESSANQNNLEYMKLLSGLIGTMLPYDQATMKDRLQVGLDYDRLNSGNMNDFLDRYMKQQQWQGDNQFRYDQLQQGGLIDWTKLFGVGPNGQPTLDAMELQLKQQEAQRLYQLRMQGMINDQQYQQAMLNLNYAKFGEQQSQNDAARMNNIIQSIDREMAQLQDAIAKGGGGETGALYQRLNVLQSQKMYMLNQMAGTPQNNQAPQIHGPWLPGKYNDPNPKW